KSHGVGVGRATRGGQQSGIPGAWIAEVVVTGIEASKDARVRGCVGIHGALGGEVQLDSVRCYETWETVEIGQVADRLPDGGAWRETVEVCACRHWCSGTPDSTSCPRRWRLR